MTRCHDAPGALPAQLPRQAMADLVAAATMAPSMHNTQPWRFRIGRPARRLTCTPTRPGCCGSVTQMAVRCISRAALRCSISGWPPRWLAASRWSGCFLILASRCCSPRCGWPGRRRPQPDELELHEAVFARRTNRSPYSSRPVPPGVLAELARAARLEGAIVHFPDHQEAIRLLGLARDAERAPARRSWLPG